ncbi:uncharacterized protein MELLADRAFT_117356 [Melampsora larici-populina 98AG31]|uniref:Enoyl reductase (ER) domain-containing protein n=1 Tax=Melampsora larici-populina (strain 98AG31 / pathotype 3-4-7) TaxID=747676 RepID=F4RWC9_MELLP|nr:uncharacterized protein MELLADRAFT_117356 [Melampsora larici-populina 98AG31]EGG03345.1 hypothetical protein MELLADRAFT_117356 [Melampsora larici-populina 98AG31]
MTTIPSTTKSIVLQTSLPSETPTWHKTSILDVPLRPRTKDEVTVRIISFSLNHRDVWIRKGLYPGILSSSILGSDCTGIIIDPIDHPLHAQQVLIYPALNWLKDPRGPDIKGKPFGILGGTKLSKGLGTFTEYINVLSSHCKPIPSHMIGPSAACIPLAGLTAYRIVLTKAKIKPNMNVLVTGIGGGVATFVLQFCLALGARVWVSSGSEEKMKLAKDLGAQDGVNYKQNDWPSRLVSLLPEDEPLLDVVIDSSGGDILQKCRKLLRDGGQIVSYGSTTGSPISITMSEVLKNLEIKTSTMGSLQEFHEMIDFIEAHQIKPIIFKTLLGFESVEEAFEILKDGKQFGKVVVEISKGSTSLKL